MRSWLVLVLYFCVVTLARAGGHPAIPEPGQTFIAPLATEAMLLDAINVDERIVVVGEKGIVLISDDAGLSWRQPQTGTRITLTGVHFSDRDNGWVVGHDSLILRTTDGGATWQEVYSDPDDQRPLFDVWFADSETGIAVGAYGLMLLTGDGGETWELTELIPEPWPDLQSLADTPDEGGDEFDFEDDEFYDFHLNHIVPAPSGDLYVAAEAGHFFRSPDSGATWYSMPTIYEGSFFNSIPLSGEQLLLIGLRGNIFRSNDGGQNWLPIDSPVTVLLNDGLLLDDGTILIGGMAGAVLESRDGGRSFSLLQQSDRKAISVILPIADGLLTVGEAGVQRTDLPTLRQGGSS
ncbi:MAG: hypothetical protein KJO55_00475 [Gammaproteobacteria bacterium]|nr:hypothetical protein [Gammaproteobacteria bacterium]NND60305.1 hypothetical protein [Gammaproteobacteria bacterium]